MMSLAKREYENILALLHRVELKGLAEAKELAVIGLKLEHKITNWKDEAETATKAEEAKVEAIPFPLHPEETK